MEARSPSHTTAWTSRSSQIIGLVRLKQKTIVSMRYPTILLVLLVALSSTEHATGRWVRPDRGTRTRTKLLAGAGNLRLRSHIASCNASKTVLKFLGAS